MKRITHGPLNHCAEVPIQAYNSQQKDDFFKMKALVSYKVKRPVIEAMDRLLQEDDLAKPDQIATSPDIKAEQHDSPSSELLTRSKLTSLAVSMSEKSIAEMTEADLRRVIKSCCADVGLIESFIDSQESIHGEAHAFEVRTLFALHDGGKDLDTIKSSVVLFMKWLEACEQSPQHQPPSNADVKPKSEIESKPPEAGDRAEAEAAVEDDSMEKQKTAAESEKEIQKRAPSPALADPAEAVVEDENMEKEKAADAPSPALADEAPAEAVVAPSPALADEAPAEAVVEDGNINMEKVAVAAVEKDIQTPAAPSPALADEAPAEAEVEAEKTEKAAENENKNNIQEPAPAPTPTAAGTDIKGNTSAQKQLDRFRAMEEEEKLKLRKLNMKGEGGLKPGMTLFDSSFQCGAGVSCVLPLIIHHLRY